MSNITPERLTELKKHPHNILIEEIRPLVEMALLSTLRTERPERTAHAVASLEASDVEPRRRRALPPGKRCDVCEGLAYRRPRGGCRRCGEAWAPEAIAVEVPAGGSSLAAIE